MGQALGASLRPSTHFTIPVMFLTDDPVLHLSRLPNLVLPCQPLYTHHVLGPPLRLHTLHHTRHVLHR